MRGGTQSFVSQMTKMVGTEPLESSHGDQSLLPTYMVRKYMHCIDLCREGEDVIPL